MSNEVSIEDLISKGYVRVGSKSYCSYWKKGDDIVTLYDYLVAVTEVQQLRNKLNEVLDKLDNLQEQHRKAWKEGADMMDRGASNAYENAYWLLKGVL